MKIAIDLCYFTSSHAGGKDEVAYNLLRGFEKNRVADQFYCFCHKDIASKVQEISPSIHIIPVPQVKYRLPFFYTEYSQLIAPQFRALFEKHYIRKLKIQALLFTNKDALLCKYRIPTVEIPHDIQIFAKGKKNLKAIVHRHILQKEFRKRDCLIAISDYDKNDMIHYLNRDPKKIARIYNPIVFKEPACNAINGKWITALNIQHKHKNVITVLKAFEKIHDQIPHDLLLVGKKTPYIQDLEKYVFEHHLENRVRFTGFVSDDELKDILNNTRVFINASLFEGFGMPAVEAIGCEIPVIIADNTAQKEVTMGLGKYYAPAEDSDALSRTILEELQETHSKEELANKAALVHDAYSYEKIAMQYYALLQEMVLKNK